MACKEGRFVVSKGNRKEIVIILWGDSEIQNYYNFAKWNAETVELILQHTEVFEFDNYEEAEAFRRGMAVVVSATARDFMELAPQGFKSLLEISNSRKKAV